MKTLDRPHTCLTSVEHTLFNEPFSLAELQLALKSTGRGKSAGPDEILPEFLINLGYKAQETLLKFVNSVWERGLPDEWRKAEVVPILKKDKLADTFEHFRPISLTSTFCKLMERMVLRRFQHFIERNGLISHNQAGFKKYRSTVDQVVRLSQEIKDGFQRRQSTLAVFIDFRTAFDRVWRQMLLKKLIVKGVHGNLYRFIASYLAQRFIRVRYGDSSSPYRQIRQGLPQGSVLSPTLFSFMLDDVVEAMKTVPGVNVLLYADDLVLYATSSNIEALQMYLHKALEVLRDWTKCNKMIVNPEKTEFQLFTLSTKPHSMQLSYDGCHLRQTNEAVYLGVTLDSRLSWSKHAEKAVSRGSKRLKLLKRLTGIKWGANQDVLTTAYKTYLRPAVEYGGELLITSSANVKTKLDLLQNSALRLLTGAPHSTPIAAMQLQSEVEPLQTRREDAAIKLYEKLKRLDDPFWGNYNHAALRLKTQEGFIQKTEELIQRKELDLGQCQPLHCEGHFLTNVAVEAHYNLVEDMVKSNATEHELKSIALETINERYPSSRWLHVFTDGSADSATANAGAGVYSKDFELCAPVGRTASNFDGEVAAVELALENVASTCVDNIVVLIDSQAAIAALSSIGITDSPIVVNCRDRLNKLADSGKRVVLQWVPSHCGLDGNERADKLAKKGARMPQPDIPVSLATSRRIVAAASRREVRSKLKTAAQGKQWESLSTEEGRINPELKRSEAVALFRLLTGHNFLQKHLHRIGVVNSPMCPLCNADDMSSEHLERCSGLSDITKEETEPLHKYKTKLYWAARRRMAEIPTAGVG